MDGALESKLRGIGTEMKGAEDFLALCVHASAATSLVVFHMDFVNYFFFFFFLVYMAQTDEYLTANVHAIAHTNLLHAACAASCCTQERGGRGRWAANTAEREKRIEERETW